MRALKHKEKQTHAIGATHSPHLPQRSSPVCRAGYGAGAGFLQATGLSDEPVRRAFWLRGARRGDLASAMLLRPAKEPFSLLDRGHEQRGVVSTVCANRCRLLASVGQTVGVQGILRPRPLRKSHAL